MSDEFLTRAMFSIYSISNGYFISSIIKGSITYNLLLSIYSSLFLICFYLSIVCNTERHVSKIKTASTRSIRGK